MLRWSCILLSYIFEIMGNRLPGQKFSLFRGSLFLYKGNTCACFSPSGNFPNLYVVFMRFEIVPLTIETHDIRIFSEILSTPVDLLMFKLDNNFVNICFSSRFE